MRNIRDRNYRKLSRLKLSKEIMMREQYYTYGELRLKGRKGGEKYEALQAPVIVNAGEKFPESPNTIEKKSGCRI